MEAKCISFGGFSVDAAVANEILRVVQPCALDAAALAVNEELRHRDDLIETVLMELKAARYAESLACKQYSAVDPDNRLVASELERRWNAALRKVKELEDRLTHEQLRVRCETPDLRSLGDLSADLARVWNSPATDSRLKKRLIRALIDEIVVDLNAEPSMVELIIHWKGGVHSELQISRRRRGQSGSHTSADLVDAVRQLALVCDDKAIASYLNRNKLVTAQGNRWCRMAITSLRNKRDIAVHSSENQQSGGWLNLTQAAAHLGVALKTIRRAAESGDLTGIHPLDDGPWIFKRADLDDPSFRERFEARLAGNASAARPDVGQLDLMISTTYRGEAL